jgi:hypothetical protein
VLKERKKKKQRKGRRRTGERKNRERLGDGAVLQKKLNEPRVEIKLSIRDPSDLRI